MCSTCGCSEGEVTFTDLTHDHEHAHEHGHHHAHSHDHSHGDEHAHHHHHNPSQASHIEVHHHYYHHGDVHHHVHYHVDALPEQAASHAAPAHAPRAQKREIAIEQQVLAKNNAVAAHNREHFAQKKLCALNFVSSPGSGKTTLLVETLHKLLQSQNCFVIEGDQQTANDADRIHATGAPAIQINTGKGCHLDAQMVHDALHQLDVPEGSYLFIENVGNLVCPASFDLGEKHKIALLSVTEGADKPLKYPHMFAAASVLLINKIDLLDYVDFDLQRCIDYAHRINPDLTIIPISVTTGQGMDEWFSYLEAQQCV